MFGFGNKKPKTALDDFITAVYGDPPPPKRANVSEASRLASEEILMGLIDVTQIRKLAAELASGPVPYSTHDLALSIALNFFNRPELMPTLQTAQLVARMKMLEWMQSGLVAPMIVRSFEDVLYKLYK